MNKSLPELERPEFSEQEAGLLLEENYGLKGSKLSGSGA